jgi:hypothetical protein
MRVVVLGAGFGGLELTTLLSEEFGADLDIVLIDQADGFIFGFAKLDVMFGRTTADQVLHPYRGIDKPGVRFVQATVQSIDPVGKRVTTSAGDFSADMLVIALGADLDPAAIPGLLEHGHDFYTPAGAFMARDTLTNFRGGNVVVGVTSTPFKCPPACSTRRASRWSCPFRCRSRRRRRRRRRCSRSSSVAASRGIPSGWFALSTAIAECWCLLMAVSCRSTSSLRCRHTTRRPPSSNPG